MFATCVLEWKPHLVYHQDELWCPSINLPFTPYRAHHATAVGTFEYVTPVIAGKYSALRVFPSDKGTIRQATN